MLRPAAESRSTRCMSTTATVGGAKAGPATAAGAAGAAAGVWAKPLERAVVALKSARPNTSLKLRIDKNLLEMRSKIKVQNLALVQTLLQERIGDIDAYQTE